MGSDPDTRLERYLREIGAPLDQDRPSAAALGRLHRAHVLRFPHDTVSQARGRTPALNEDVLVESLLGGEGGSCIRLNGSFAWLLRSLGYDVTLHRCRVQRGLDTEVRPQLGMHAVLRVRLPEGTWHADAGLGNGPLDPMPLQEGTWRQDGGFEYTLCHGRDPESSWRFEHDRRLRGLRAVEIADVPATVQDFADVWAEGSSPEYVSRVPVTINRRLERGVLTLAGTNMVTYTEDGRQMRTIGDPEEWERTVREDFGLALPGWTTEERDVLWSRVVSTGAERLT